MDWALSDPEASAVDGMEAFLSRVDSRCVATAVPSKGFTFLNDACEMLRISREIEGDFRATMTPTRVYVGSGTSRPNP